MNEELLLRPVSKDLLYVKIAGAIQRYIQQNQLKVGDRLPSERNLAEQFDASRHCVREALRVLEGEGIIEVKSAKGIFVAGGQDKTSVYIKLIQVNYKELLGIKSVLDKLAIQSAVKTATEQDLKDLERILFEMEKEATKGRYAEPLDKEFHQEIARISGNKTLQQMICSIIEVFDAYNKELQQSPQMSILTIPAHRQLLEEMKRGNATAAQNAYDQICTMDTDYLDEVYMTNLDHQLRGASPLTGSPRL